MRSIPVDTYIDFIGLYLSQTIYSGAEMVLERIASSSTKYINESVIAKLGK